MIGYKNGATSLYLAKREGKDLLYVGKAGTGFTNSGALGSQSLEVRKVTRRHPIDAERQAHRLGFTFLRLGDLPPTPPDVLSLDIPNRLDLTLAPPPALALP